MFRRIRFFLPVLALLIVGTTLPAQNSSPETSNAERKLPGASEQPAATPAPATPETSSRQTKTSEAGVVDSHDPLLDVPPPLKGKATLIGGTVAKIDRVRNIVTVRPYGGGAMKVYFDERSHIYRDGAETTPIGIRKGDRVYLDTMLDGPRVIAKNIRVDTQAQAAEAHGQLLAYSPGDGRVELRDELSSHPLSFLVTRETRIKRGEEPGSYADLLPGALVDVKFAPGGADQGVAREITVVAKPGSTFIFAGKITHLDLRSGLLAIDNHTDDKTYEIQFDPRNTSTNNLGVGAEVTVDALFDGSRYMARSVTVISAAKD